MKNRINKVLYFIYGHKFLFSALVNLSLLVFYLVFYMIVYETVDDNFLSTVISGFNGNNSPYLVVFNYVLGSILKFFYTLNQNIPWYDLAQYSVCFMAVTSIQYFLLKTIKNPKNIFPVIVLDIFISYELFAKPQFTKTAGFATVGGILVILYYTLFNDRINKLAVIGIMSGCLLALAGYLYRYDAFLMTVPLCSSVGVFYLIMVRSDKKIVFKKLVTCGIALATLVILVGSAYLINSVAYSSDEWKDYLVQNTERSDITDCNCIQYYESDTAKEKFGIDEVDIKIIGKLFMGDNDFFSTENLIQYNDTLINNGFSFIENTKEIAELFIYEYLYYHYQPMWLLISCVIIWLLFKKINLKDSLLLFYVLGIIVLVFYLLSLKHRYINRLSSIIFYTSAIPVIMMFDKKQMIRGLRKNIIAVIAVFAIFQSFHPQEYKISRYNATYIQNARDFYSEISKDPEHLYVLASDGFEWEIAYGPFDNIPFGQGENIYNSFSWLAYTPTERAVLKKYNIDNLPADIVDNDKVYLLDNDIDSSVAYIRKHYSKDAEAVICKNIRGHNVYKIVS